MRRLIGGLVHVSSTLHSEVALMRRSLRDRREKESVVSVHLLFASFLGGPICSVWAWATSRSSQSRPNCRSQRHGARDEGTEGTDRDSGGAVRQSAPDLSLPPAFINVTIECVHYVVDELEMIVKVQLCI